ncbi:MAG TPA: hypothetical protein VFJ82_13600 [Longimicrobium sp.]|nr:hypothetical protein [Longimicrobium sp.]
MRYVLRIAAVPLLFAAPLQAQTPGTGPVRTPPPPPPAQTSPPTHGAAAAEPHLAGRPAAADAATTRAPASLPPVVGGVADGCTIRDIVRLGRNPTPAELRCRYGARGPGRFGLLSYLDVPVYQPVTPQPGTHVVGVPGMPHPVTGESYEQWEWRVLRTKYGPGVGAVHREMELLDPIFATRLMRFERDLAVRGVRARRRETWRSPERQAYIFQQGRSRPGPVATTTLTSWHNRVDRNGRPAGRAADYDVAPRDLAVFHEVAASLGLESYGADSNDPGHVFLPDTDAATGMEVAVLRLLPRVPHVTLATGRPYDEPPIPGMPNHWRELTALFLSRWVPWPSTEIRVGPPALAAVRLPKPRPQPVPPPVPARRGRRPR